MGELGIKRAEEALRQHPEWSRPAQLGAASLRRPGTKGKSDRVDRASDCRSIPMTI